MMHWLYAICKYSQYWCCICMIMSHSILMHICGVRFIYATVAVHMHGESPWFVGLV